MVNSLTVGTKVKGVCEKVFEKGAFPSSDKKLIVRGTITAQVGKGRSRKWTVTWDYATKSSTIHARRLDRDHDGATSSEDDTSSSDSGDSSSSDDGTGQVPDNPQQPAQQVSLLDPHGRHWEHVTDVKVDMNSSPKRNFTVKWPNDLPHANRRPIDYFWAMFPRDGFDQIIAHTNLALQLAQQKDLTLQELYVFFGLIYAMSVVHHPTRRSYWEVGDKDCVFPAPNFGKFGISCNRFEKILSCLRCAPAHEETDRWCHIRAVVDAFNAHRATKYTPSWRLCVDEKTSSFRPRKGAHLDDGPPALAKIMRKPKPISIELKDISDGDTRVCLGLELQEGKEAMAIKEFTNQHNAGTACLLRLAKPWAHSGRLVVGDSAFASVAASIACADMGLHFTGVVKTATRQFPKKYLESVALPDRGDQHVVISNPSSTCRLIGVAWNGGKKRKTLVSTCGVTTSASKPHTRTVYRNLGDGTSGKKERSTPWPDLVSTYFTTANASDVHNHYRQGSLALEEIWITQTWWHRVLATVFGICEVDAYLVYRKFFPGPDHLSHRQFTEEIALCLIRNEIGSTGPHFRRQTAKRGISEVDEEEPIPHSLALFSNCASLQRDADGKRHQRCCKICKLKCSCYCPACSDVAAGKFFSLCGSGTKRGAECYNAHLPK